MSATVFVDANVLVYTRDASEPEKQPVAVEWMTYLWRTRMGRLSVQVLEEFYVIVTRKLDPGLSREDARRDLRNLTAWRPLPMETAILEGAWAVEDRFGLSWWDSLIVSAAQRAGCRYLLTEDLQDGLRLDGVTVVDPFGHTPESLQLREE